ncbi:hypothetical protein K502DRAFT_353777 [Neoconidiobolus thromboides FSU 785]|nr:hypothetical protein K502DRAFT_353777 [Neoconidiobolus thromboides FSU 785]
MLYGDNKLRKEFKRALICTYIIRVFLLLPLVFGVLFEAAYIFLGRVLCPYYSLVIFLGSFISTSIQIYLLIHYLRSIHDTGAYLKLNKRQIPYLEANERASYQLEVVRVRYQPQAEGINCTLSPPNYSQAVNAPPGY